MTWANFDDCYPDHPKVVGLSDGAFRLNTSAICYCARFQTDGFIPKPLASKLTPNFRNAHLGELTRAGLWKAEGGGYWVHDYLQWNRSRAQIEEARLLKSMAGKKGAEKRWREDGDE